MKTRSSMADILNLLCFVASLCVIACVNSSRHNVKY